MTTYPLESMQLAREEFGIPAIAPIVSPGALRPAVDEELHGIFLAGIEVRRLDQEAFDFVVVSAGEPEGFERRHRDLGEHGIVEVGEGLRGSASLVDSGTFISRRRSL